MGGTGGRRTAAGLALISALTAALPALTKNLALELAPIRVNLIAAGFVDTPLSAAILGDRLDTRREQLRTTLPIRRVIGPADIAVLAVHLMTNTADTGATVDIDAGERLVEGRARLARRIGSSGLQRHSRLLMRAAACRPAPRPCTRRTSPASPHRAGRSDSRARRARPPHGGARPRAQPTT